MKTPLNVYVRRIKDREVTQSIPYNDLVGQRALDRFVRGLSTNLDTTKHFVDTGEVDLAIAKRRR